MFDMFKKDKSIKKLFVEKLDEEIREKASDPDVSAKELLDLWETRSSATKNDRISADTIAKIAGNVVIVIAIMAFETRYIINKNATKFIVPLK